MTTINMTRLGYLMSGLFALFIAGASVLPKLLGLDAATVTLTDLGWPDGYALTIGLIELGCLILYLIPRTSVLGAVLFMGLLGGAIATRCASETR